MRILLVALALALSPVAAAAVQIGIANETVDHGGGCRKDSPQGMCCHAGSQPYHCH
ncbi:MAG: hypothetical protein ACU0GG_20580 [Paracoccaceae bacterium]